eukprot:8311881-Pyramimonas_sp.AAC.1
MARSRLGPQCPAMCCHPSDIATRLYVASQQNWQSECPRFTPHCAATPFEALENCKTDCSSQPPKVARSHLGM